MDKIDRGTLVKEETLTQRQWGSTIKRFSDCATFYWILRKSKEMHLIPDKQALWTSIEVINPKASLFRDMVRIGNLKKKWKTNNMSLICSLADSFSPAPKCLTPMGWLQHLTIVERIIHTDNSYILWIKKRSKLESESPESTNLTIAGNTADHKKIVIDVLGFTFHTTESWNQITYWKLVHFLEAAQILEN